jgi:WD40 repeat protein
VLRAIRKISENPSVMNGNSPYLQREFYVVGGTMPQEAPSYVERQADNDLFAAVMRGEFCYLLTARQMGKSSLMIRTVTRLRAAGITVAALDLTAIGQNLPAEKWYGGLLVQIGQRLGLEDEMIEFWVSHLMLGPMQRWITAIRTVVLKRCPGRLAIFIDEIDVVRSLPFSTDEFFAGIRECHNIRGEDSEMDRVTFCLLGVATPADLIQDPSMTPFNIGRRIELHDFTGEEASPLAYGLGRKVREGAALLVRVLYWTGGHPYLTQRLCQAVAEEESITGDKGVDRLCKELFISPRARECDHNLLFVREQLLRGGSDTSSLLDLYARVWKRRNVRDTGDDPLISLLRLSGVTRAEAGRLKVRNHIYNSVFDKTWIMSNLPDAEVQRQRMAFRRGVWRTALVSLVILALMGALAITAFRQRDRAEQQAAANRRLLYLAQMKIVQQEWEQANVDRVEELLLDQIPQHGEEDLRNVEWQWLWQVTHREIFRYASDRPVTGVTILPDGLTVAFGETMRAKPRGGDEYLITLCNTESQKKTEFAVPAGKNIDLVVFSPDRRRVAVDGPDYEVSLYDLDSGQKTIVFPGDKAFPSAITFSLDSKHLAVGRKDGTVSLYDIGNHLVRKTLHQHGDLIRSIAFSPDGRTIAVADESPKIWVWDVATRRELTPFVTDEEGLEKLTFLPDGKSLLVAAIGGRMHLWDVHSRKMKAALTGHSSSVEAIAVSQNGKMLATGSADRTVRLWDAVTGREKRTIRGHGSAVKSVAWSDDGNRLITGSLDGAVKIWDVQTLEPVQPAEPVIKYFATAFSSNNDLMAFGVAKNSQVKLWNLSTGQEIAKFNENARNILFASFSQDGKRIATCGQDYQVRIWEAFAGKLIHTMTGHQAFVQSVDFSPDGTMLVSGGEDKSLRLWDTATGREIGRFDGGAENYYRAAFSPDGKKLASSCRDGRVKLWDVATRTLILYFTGHMDRVRAIAFSWDNRLLATGGKDNSVRVWDVATGQLLKRLGRSDTIQRAAFSADGKRLVTGGMDGTVKLWDVDMQQELMTLIGHTDAITSVTFSTDGQSLATSGSDGIVRIWRGDPVMKNHAQSSQRAVVAQ